MTTGATPDTPDARTDSTSTLAWLRAAGRVAAMLPLVLFIASAWYLYREDVARAKLAVDRVALVAEEHTQKVFETNISLIRRVQDGLGAQTDAMLLEQERDIHDALKRMSAELPQLQGIFVMGANGRMVATDRVFPAPHDIDYTDRELYRHHRDGGPQPLVTELLTSRATGEPFFDVSLRRSLPDGTFGGTVSTSLRPDYFHRFYQQLVGGENIGVALVRRDGAMLASWPDAPVPGDTRAGAARQRMPQAGSEVSEQRVPGGGTGFLARRGIANYPVDIVAWIAWPAVLADWYRQIALLAALMLPLAAGLVYLTRVAEQKTRRSLEAYEALRLEAARRQRVEDVLRQAQKLEAVGRLTGGVAHDFNNLLTVVHTNAYLLKRIGPGLADNAQLAAIERAVETGTRLTRQLLSFSRAQPLHAETILLQEHLSPALEIVRTAVGGRVTLHFSVEAGTAPITVDTAELELALLNVCINAKDAMPEGGELAIRARNATRGEPAALEGAFVVIEVQDGGTGIAPDVIEHVFDPFFTTKPAGHGTGLGLSQVYGFCVSAGGTARVTSRLGEGTTVRLYLPAATGPVKAGEAGRQHAPQRLDGVRVLLVEDNVEVATATSAVLESSGCSVVVAANADDAHRRLAKHPGEVDIVLSDIVMPGTMNGIAFAKLLMRERPDLPVVLTSGYSEQTAEALELGLEVVGKPAAPHALVAAIGSRLRTRPRR